MAPSARDTATSEYAITPWSVPEGYLLTARSHFVDRIVPDCELVRLPEKEVGGGILQWRLGAFAAEPSRQGRFARLRRVRRGSVPSDRCLVDLRHHDPDNWAHALNNHFPLVFHLAALAGLELERLCLLLPSGIPGHIREAAGLFGMEVLASDDIVEGQGITFDVTPWTALRAARAQWVRLPAPVAALEAALSADAAGTLPKRVFLARRSTRYISNMPDLETVLQARNLVTVYPEDLSVIDQFRLFREAEEIVAVHGAGLAPLLYTVEGAMPRRLIEILPCGHMTDVYRVMAAQIGCDWIGVRGRIKSEYVQPAYDLSQPFKTYSLDPFEVDPLSLERAFEMADDRAAKGRE